MSDLACIILAKKGKKYCLVFEGALTFLGQCLLHFFVPKMVGEKVHL